MSPTRIDKSKGQKEDSGASSKRKRLQEAQEVCIVDTVNCLRSCFCFSLSEPFLFCWQTPLSKRNKMLDENLVGSRIKVWWPDDKM